MVGHEARLVPRPTLTLVRSREAVAPTLADKARAAFAKMETYTKFWESPEAHREQIAIAQELADRENTLKKTKARDAEHMKARGAKRAAPGAKKSAECGAKTFADVEREARAVLGKRPHINQTQLANAIYSKVGKSAGYVRDLLVTLNIPPRKK